MAILLTRWKQEPPSAAAELPAVAATAPWAADGLEDPQKPRRSRDTNPFGITVLICWVRAPSGKYRGIGSQVLYYRSVWDLTPSGFRPLPYLEDQTTLDMV